MHTPSPGFSFLSGSLWAKRALLSSLSAISKIVCYLKLRHGSPAPDELDRVKPKLI